MSYLVRFHRLGPLRLSVAVLVGFVLAAIPGASSAGLAIRTDQALANFNVAVAPCVEEVLTVTFTAGTVKDPLGTAPGPFSDVVAELRIFDTCVGGELAFFSGVTTGVEPNIITLEEAILENVELQLSNGTVLDINLVWEGNDDASELTGIEGDSLRVERFVTAEVTGVVTADGVPAYIAPDDISSSRIDIHQELNIPR